MTKIFTSVSDLVGNTPLIELVGIEKKYNLKAKIYAKLEYFNPAGSAKDRVAKYIIDIAEKNGELKKGSTIIEPTSGNTGIGLASIGVSKGYKVLIVMPDSMSQERIKLIKAYGAEIVLTDGKLGMAGAITKAEQLQKEIPNSIIAGQFTNSANPLAHYKTTGPEIFNDTNGNIDIFVSAVGTGGTISGVGKYLKEKNKQIKVVAVEPTNSPLLSQNKSGSHKIQGIGANFVPKTLDLTVVDEILTVSDEDAFTYGKMVGKEEGVLVGISSGAALSASIQLATRQENEGKNIVVLFADGGDRYLSTELYE